MEMRKEGAQTVGKNKTNKQEKNPNLFYILVIPKNILVFLNYRKLVVFSHSWCFYPVSVPTFCEEKCFTNAGGTLNPIALLDWKKFGSWYIFEVPSNQVFFFLFLKNF